MKRQTLAAMACAFVAAVPLCAAAQDYQTEGGLPNTVYSGRAPALGWVQNDIGDIASLRSSNTRTGLVVACYGDNAFDLSIGTLSNVGIETMLRPRERDDDLASFQSMMNGAQVVAVNRAGQPLTSFQVKLERFENSETTEAGSRLHVWINRAQLDAIRAADRIEVRRGQTTLSFTGAGSSRATNFSNCAMDGM